MKKLNEKIAIVTGGSRGIGKGIVKALAEAGATVVFTYTNSKEQADGLAETLTGEGLSVHAVMANNAIDGEITSAFRGVIEKFGHLDILVNSAGVYQGKPLAGHTLADYRSTMDVNVKAVFEAMIFAAGQMANEGRIITIGSNMAERVVFPGGALYAMSKSALVGLTKGAARDLGSRGITVNLVQPGPVDTDMNPENSAHAAILKKAMIIPRYAQTSQIADIVLYLAAPEAAYTTGSVITIDGGFNC